jgi:asparagine synthase (glutamine-hydrolysing)
MAAYCRASFGTSMCGIAGILWPGKSPQPFIELALSEQRHRGPDDSGVWKAEHIAFIHNRLTIIDPEGGQQPMQTEQLVLTFNGEIYNYQELKKELSTAGYSFRSRSDTEVVLHGFDFWGIDLFPKLRGMFAIAIFDKKSQILTLARDRFGIKPLHYFTASKGFAFASELSVLMSAFKAKLTIDPTSVFEFLKMQFIAAPKTIFKETRKLEAGTWLQINANGKVLKKASYSIPQSTSLRLSTADLSFEEATRETASVIQESVNAHLMADVELGSFLSGGIDSTLITYFAAQSTTKKLKTFSIGFTDAKYDESSYARQAAKQLNTDHHEWIVDSIHPDEVFAMVNAYSEPFGDSSALPTYWVSKMAAKQVKVVLSGDGGDELFFGYPRFLHWLKRTERYSDHSPFKRWYVQELRKALPNRYGPMSGEPDFDAWAKGLQGFSNTELVALYGNKNKVKNPFSEEKKWFEGQHRNALSDISRNADIRYYLRDDLLPKMDVATMLNSLEARPPLLDSMVFDWAMKLPLEYLYKADTQKMTFQGKLPLKEILSAEFDFDFVNRPKMGFSIPLQKWLNDGGPLFKLYQDISSDPNSALFDWLDPTEVENWHQSQKQNSTFSVFGQWTLLVLGIWLTQWKTRPGYCDYD